MTGTDLYPYKYEKVLHLPSESILCEEETADDVEEKQCVHGSNQDCVMHNKTNDEAKKKLVRAAVLSVTFMVIELIGGYMAGSLAIMSDAAHLITDSLTFVVGALGIYIAEKRPNAKMNFGYKRVEVLCAMISIIGIWILTSFIFYFAVQRMFHQNDFTINTNTMLVVSILGVLVNILMAATLHGGFSHIFHHSHSHDSHSLLNRQHAKGSENKNDQDNDVDLQMQREPENINVEAASLHVLGDFIQSVGVIIAAVIIKVYPQAKIVDPLITFSFSIIVLCTTLKIFGKSLGILLEAVPDHVNYEKLLSDLKSIEGIKSVRDLKVWSLSSDFHASTVHIVIQDLKFHRCVLRDATNLLSKQVQQSSIQIELE